MIYFGVFMGARSTEGGMEFPEYEVEEVSVKGGWLAAKVGRDFRLWLKGDREVGTVMEINTNICQECQFNKWNITPRQAVTTGSCKAVDLFGGADVQIPVNSFDPSLLAQAACGLEERLKKMGMITSG
ncbi:hypothetical protein A2634_02800 [Candidatus Amesbacteria bacterium RIFCSPHIGHO2_01_FULL_48_32]|uniref:Uncharacterized protein n=1 Tax=Candidatus Amesbacteria bacterium RIFCSPLOWO2_01_FULL_48_25 TaxID=1797259 RepID=A0A1F4Z9U0_9BACT|nr:MAG: hypothetical protein A2634_02800 [Candidatus Amesbacteria bacterium RIFCSPHIGHO2_01_FULL_48_32]OGD03058.1 MAG: hypothetical protein A2989_02020 [Candidatus Amesbacteria bacterium RIFCSPLOWO2_01_FULL_48_25]